MWITRLRYVKHPRWSAASILTVPLLVALLGCGPVIETTVRERLSPPAEARSVERVTILLDTSRLERTSETLDPARLKARLEEELRSSGVFRQYRVDTTDVPADGGAESVTVALSRLEYVVQGTRFPPAPPLGLFCLYPAVTPVLLERNYLTLQAAVEGELLVHDSSGAVTGSTYVAESASGRANFFGTGKDKAATVLQDIAFRNFSEQVVRELLFLTR